MRVTGLMMLRSRDVAHLILWCEITALEAILRQLRIREAIRGEADDLEKSRAHLHALQ